MNIQWLWSVMQGYTDGLSTAEVLRIPLSIPKLLYYVGWLLRVAYTGWYAVLCNTSSDSYTAAPLSLAPHSKVLNDGWMMLKGSTLHTACSVHMRSSKASRSALSCSVTKGWMPCPRNVFSFSSRRIKKHTQVITSPERPLVVSCEMSIFRSKCIQHYYSNTTQGQIF